MAEIVNLEKTKEIKQAQRKIDIIDAVENIWHPCPEKSVYDFGSDAEPELLKRIKITKKQGIKVYCIKALGILGTEKSIETIRECKPEFEEECDVAIRRIMLRSKLNKLKGDQHVQ